MLKKIEIKEMNKMNILIVVFGILSIFCMGYYVFSVSYAGISSAFLGFWLLSAIGFAVVMIIMIFHKKKNILDVIPTGIKIIVCTLLIAGVVFFVTMEGMIISKMNSKASDDIEYLVVLGAQVKGSRVTKSLAKRLDAAYDYLVLNPETMVVCTGGQGVGEDITEASAMMNYLIEAGIKKDRIILEDKSTSTYENLKFTLDILDKTKKIAVVTNNFHVYRAMYLADKVGFKDVQGVAGKSDNRLLLNYMVREGFALAKEIVVR